MWSVCSTEDRCCQTQKHRNVFFKKLKSTEAPRRPMIHFLNPKNKRFSPFEIKCFTWIQTLKVKKICHKEKKKVFFKVTFFCRMWNKKETVFITTCFSLMFEDYCHYIQFKSSNMLKIHHIKHFSDVNLNF